VGDGSEMEKLPIIAFPPSGALIAEACTQAASSEICIDGFRWEFKMNGKENKSGLALAGSLLAAFAASLCCILPLVAAVLGLGGFAAAAFFEKWRPYLLMATAALLAIGFYLVYRWPQEDACAPGSTCEGTAARGWGRTLLWLVAALVIVVATFPYYSGWAAHAVTGNMPPLAAGQQKTEAHLVLKVDGMDCGACAALIQKNLQQVAGVERAEVSYEKKQAAIDYDPREVNPSRFAQIINNAGFKVGGRAPGRLRSDNP